MQVYKMVKHKLLNTKETALPKPDVCHSFYILRPENCTLKSA